MGSLELEKSGQEKISAPYFLAKRKCLLITRWEEFVVGDHCGNVNA